ncbi:MAG TPA: O-antigen ligase family protein [Pyrinomonadaceae bacterium]|nr:O-antigen ligase family protein [Pyrinomonadaceae bacterium]
MEGSSAWTPGRPFYFGLALTLLATWIPFVPAWNTFIHIWRVDLAASVFLFFTLSYLFFRSNRPALFSNLSNQERRLIVYPIIAFISWSALSIAWSPSWKSAVHHTLLWSEYLSFYLLVRYLVDHSNNFSKLVKTIAIVLVLFALPALVEYTATISFGGSSTFRARFAKYGEQIVTLLPLLLVILFRSSGRRFQTVLAAVVLMWLLIYSTAGRVNMLLFAAVIGGMGIGVFFLQRYRRNFAVLLLAVVLAPVPFYLFSLAVGTPDIPIAARFADSVGNSFSLELRKLMNTVSVEMFKSAPVTGVGADNYGLQYNNYRERYSALNPDDPNLRWGEIGIVGQAHNEYLQIAAELGIVGVAIFGWFLVGLAFLGWKSIAALKKGSLVPFASTLGLAMFLASSAVSSYSFRLVPNAFVFFVVLAVASKTLLKQTEKAFVAEKALAWTRPALAAGIAACLLLATYSSIRVASVIVTEQANRTLQLEDAVPLYQTAMMLDNENPDVRNNFGKRYFRKERYGEAVPLLAESIRIGRAESTDFSYLATCQFLSGNSSAAEATMEQAATYYPRSPFVLTRYAGVLHDNGKAHEATIYLNKALDLDRPAANTWWTMINRGSQVASDMAFSNPEHRPIMDLWPTASIYAVLDERQIRHPEEKTVFRP